MRPKVVYASPQRTKHEFSPIETIPWRCLGKSEFVGTRAVLDTFASLDMFPSRPQTSPCLKNSTSSWTFPNSSSGMETRSVILSVSRSSCSRAVIVPGSLHKALTKRYAVQPVPLSQSFKCLSRVRSDLQGSRYWLCCHGFHRLLCQTHPHPHVRITLASYLVPFSNITPRNNILVCVPYQYPRPISY